MKGYLLLIGLCFVSLTQVMAQSCGAHPSADDLRDLLAEQPRMRSFDANQTRGVRDFPVQAHIIRRSSGSGGMSIQELNGALELLNSYFINANIRFVLLPEINYINSDTYYDFDTKNENALAAKYDVRKVINLYLFNSMVDRGYPLCGYAHYPNRLSHKLNKDRILMRNECANNTSSLIHEFGHFFGLFHTHGSAAAGTAPELVTRAFGQRNCETAGDGLCDTPADPNLLNHVDRDCEYVGSLTDDNGDAYQPEPRNIMAYSHQHCRDILTKGQYARMNYAALNMRNYIQFPEYYQPELTDDPIVSVNQPSRQPAKLSGELDLSIAGQPLPFQLDGNLYKSMEPYYSGTNYQLSIKNDEQAFVYVFASDLSKQNYLLFPQSRQDPYISTKKRWIALPGGGQMYQMDNTLGKDYLCILYSKKPLDIDNLLDDMRWLEGNFIQRLYKILGEEVVPANQVMYSKTGKIQFYSKSTYYDVVPIILEIPHI
ncbi:MAG: M43 family zinc metalloprotease [Bacteroidota bacterium]